MEKRKNSESSTFSQHVRQVVRNIPKGSVWTYSEVAAAAGSPGAARAVGTIMAHNTEPQVPCHRVVLNSGRLGGYNGLRGEKFNLLKKEGIPFVANSEQVDFSRLRTKQ